MKRTFLILLLASIVLVSSVSAQYNQTFNDDNTIFVNQSFVQDPTDGHALPFPLWVLSGCIALGLVVLALRSKTQKSDYESNILISVLAWPFVWYFTWGGLTSVDLIVGITATTVNGTASAFVTQHILYSWWVLGFIGALGSIFAAFVTALLVSQYNLFKDNEEKAAIKNKQED